MKLMNLKWLGLSCLLTLTACNDDNDAILLATPAASALVIGHRGASALRPEHTLAAYQKAMDDGADFIEPDLVMSQDGVLFARHENEISGTSNVADLNHFSTRKSTKNIDGLPFTGWFTEDFSATELKQLKARERIPNIRAANVAYNDQFSIPTLNDIIELAAANYQKTGKAVGLYIETKHPTYFQQNNLAMEQKILAALNANAYSRDTAPIFLQSFEVSNLKDFKNRLAQFPALKRVKLVQLYGSANTQPFDAVVQNLSLSYADMATAAGLANVALYAQGVGPSKNYIFDSALKPTEFVKNAHSVKLLVHPYTFRPENNFLPTTLQCSSNAAQRCETGAIAEVQLYLNAGVDGVFADDPAQAVKARQQLANAR